MSSRSNNAPHHFTAYGLAVSADMPVPWLTRRSTRAPADLFVHFTGSTEATAPPDLQRPLHEVADHVERFDLPNGDIAVQYADGTRFVIDAAARNVWCSWRDPFTIEDVATYLLGPIFGLIIRMRGTTCLHASGVAIGDGAVLFAGPAGAGKSTTAAAFNTAGFHSLCDDVAALDQDGDVVRVRTGYPVLRLWPDAVTSLYGESANVPPLTPNWDKLRLDVPATPDYGDASGYPLRVIFILRFRVPTYTPPVRISGVDALIELIANSYPANLLNAAIRSAEMQTFAQKVNAVPMYSLAVRDNAAFLPEMVEMVTNIVTNPPSSNAGRS